MRINVYKSYAEDRPVRIRKWVRNIFEAQSFCNWYEQKFGEKVNYVICR